MVGNHGNFNSNVLYFSNMLKQNEIKRNKMKRKIDSEIYETKIKYRYTIMRIFCKEAEIYLCEKIMGILGFDGLFFYFLSFSGWFRPKVV